VCKNFFQNEIDKLAERVAKKLEGLEFNSFLIGSIPSGEMMKNEEKMWSETGIEFVEPIKSEINRELGKRVEKLTGKKFNLASPDMTIVVDLGTDRIRLQVKSLYIAGGYKKLVRGIPQTKWLCADCGGKGCKKCKGLGKLYKTSVQEEIEKPLIKAVKAKKSKFHGAGREDIDARCLDYRPFVIELVRPMKRKVDLKKLAKEVNRSKKVKVSSLKLVDKDYVVKIKTERLDKTYMAEVIFLKDIDRKKLRLVKQMIGTVSQQTPARVLHRRADKMRKRMVKSISVKIVGKRKLKIKVKAESGLYIKELMSGDSGRTRTNVADMLNNKVKKISLDVIKIHD
jgi:tRNA pseudouridine synthase 10